MLQTLVRICIEANERRGHLISMDAQIQGIT